MMKALIVAAALALQALAAQAGEMKHHKWPFTPPPQEVTTIPVVMDVGCWIRIKDQDKLKITLRQDAIHSYSGCTSAAVETNSHLAFSCSISKVTQDGGDLVPGDYSCSLSPSRLDAPGGTLTVCVAIAKADLSKIPGGVKNVHVANLTMMVVPRACP